LWMSHDGPVIAGVSEPIILGYETTTGSNIFFWDSAGTLGLRINGVIVTTVADTTGGFTTENLYRHYGLVAYANASTGWMSAYIDGNQVLTATGQNTGTSITWGHFGWYRASSGFGPPTRWDDFYIDTASGSEADEAPPELRFDFRTVDGDGAHSAWTPSAGSNYQNVDDAGAHDGDTTYNSAASASLQDSYTTTGVTVPANYKIDAEIPSVIARRVTGTEEIKIGLTDDSNDDLSAAKSMSTSYALYQERFTTQPDGTDWNETDGDATDVLIESAGTY